MRIAFLAFFCLPLFAQQREIRYNIVAMPDSYRDCIVKATLARANGSTEQLELKLPFEFKFYANAGAFLYLSAQMGRSCESIHVEIHADGKLIGEANSSVRYGIATAKGEAPR